MGKGCLLFRWHFLGFVFFWWHFQDALGCLFYRSVTFVDLYGYRQLKIMHLYFICPFQSKETKWMQLYTTPPLHFQIRKIQESVVYLRVFEDTYFHVFVTIHISVKVTLNTWPHSRSHKKVGSIYESTFTYRPFHKTLPISSAFINRISVRFYETYCIIRK